MNPTHTSDRVLLKSDSYGDLSVDNSSDVVSSNAKSMSVYDFVRRAFNKCGDLNRHLEYIFGYDKQTGLPNWFDDYKKDFSDDAIAPYLRRHRKKLCLARGSAHKASILREAQERMSDNWYVLFCNLTVTDRYLGEVFQNPSHPKHGTHWTEFRRKLTRNAAEACFGVVDPRFKHDPKRRAHADTISDPVERKQYLNKSIPVSEYISFKAVCELGKETHRPHMHAVVFVRDFIGTDPNSFCRHGQSKYLVDSWDKSHSGVPYPNGSRARARLAHPGQPCPPPKGEYKDIVALGALGALWLYGNTVIEAVRYPGDPFTHIKGWNPTEDSMDRNRSGLQALAAYLGKEIGKAYTFLEPHEKRDLPFRVKSSVGFGKRLLLKVLNSLSDKTLHFLSHAKTFNLSSSLPFVSSFFDSRLRSSSSHFHDPSILGNPFARHWDYAGCGLYPSLIRPMILRILAGRVAARPGGIDNLQSCYTRSVPRATLPDVLRSLVERSEPLFVSVPLPRRDPYLTRVAVSSLFSQLNPALDYAYFMEAV